MKSNSESMKLARITNTVRVEGGVTQDVLETILNARGINREVSRYRDMLVQKGYLYLKNGKYFATQDGKNAGRITILVTPVLNAEEVRQHIEDMLAPYHGVVTVGEVR